MKKETVLSLVLFIATTAIGISISEVIAKKVIESELVYWSAFIPDENVGWRFKPNVELDVEWYKGIRQRMISNKFGYRDSPNPSENKNDNKIISIQGDPNLIGYGIHSADLVSNTLGNLLNNAAAEHEYTVVNAGTSGYDLQNYVLQFPEIQSAYNPEYNFVFFNMDNDHLYTFLSTPYNLPRPFYDLESGELKLHDPEYKIRSQLYPLKFVPSMMSENENVWNYYFGTWNYGYIDGIAAHSSLAYLIGNRLGYHNKLSQLVGFNPVGEEVGDKEYSVGFTFCILSRYQKNWHPIFDHGQRLITQLLAKYGSYSTTKTIVVLLPDKLELVDRDELDNMFKEHSSSQKPNREQFYLTMKESISSAGLQFIDLRPIFVESGALEDLYLQGNSHLGSSGHSLIANTLANYILEGSEARPDQHVSLLSSTMDSSKRNPQASTASIQ